jgi:hypothetical protein
MATMKISSRLCSTHRTPSSASATRSYRTASPPCHSDWSESSQEAFRKKNLFLRCCSSSAARRLEKWMEESPDAEDCVARLRIGHAIDGVERRLASFTRRRCLGPENGRLAIGPHLCCKQLHPATPLLDRHLAFAVPFDLVEARRERLRTRNLLGRVVRTVEGVRGTRLRLGLYLTGSIGIAEVQ